MKQDRNGVRTAQDLERKYDLASLVGIKKAVKNNEVGLNKTNAELENFVSTTLENMEELQSQIDGNITTYYYSGVPTLSNLPASEWDETKYNVHLGDLYYDKDTGYAYRFYLDSETNIYGWVKITDSDVTEALKLSEEAKDTADGKRRVFTTTPFVPYDVGDLWLNNKDLYVCVTAKSTGSFTESDFEIATKYTSDEALNNFVDVTYTESMKSLNELINTKITTWYYDGEPTLENSPASGWGTDETKATHIGDLYYDKSTGYTYRFNFENGVYSWGLIKDEDLTEALALANSAQDTADNKRRVFIAQPEPPYDNGDLWFTDGDIYICQISKPAGETYVEEDFIIATKYTDDTLATQIGNELTVVQGTVTTIKESQDEFKITLETTTQTLDQYKREVDSSLEQMTYSFGTRDFRIASSEDPVNASFNNQGVKIYTYKDLNSIFNHNGTGVQKLIVVGESQLANLKIVKATDENGNACTDFHHLISEIQSLSDLED